LCFTLVRIILIIEESKMELSDCRQDAEVDSYETVPSLLCSLTVADDTCLSHMCFLPVKLVLTGCRIVSLTVLFDKDTDALNVQKILDYAASNQIKLEVEPSDNRSQVQTTSADVTVTRGALQPIIPPVVETPGVNLRKPSASSQLGGSPNRPAIHLDIEDVGRPTTVTDLPEAVFDLPDGRKTVLFDADLDIGELSSASADLDGDESVNLGVGHLKLNDGQSTGGPDEGDINELVVRLDAGLAGVQAAPPEMAFDERDSDVFGERAHGRVGMELGVSSGAFDDVPLTEEATLSDDHAVLSGLDAAAGFTQHGALTTPGGSITVKSGAALDAGDTRDALSLNVAESVEVGKGSKTGVRFSKGVAPKMETQASAKSQSPASSGYVAAVPSGKRLSPKTSGSSDVGRDGSVNQTVGVPIKLESTTVPSDFNESASSAELRTNASALGTKRSTVKSTLTKLNVIDDSYEATSVGAEVEIKVPTTESDVGYQMKAAVVDVSSDWSTENLHVTEQTIAEEINSPRTAATFDVSRGLILDDEPVAFEELKTEAQGQDLDNAIALTAGVEMDVTTTASAEVKLTKSSPVVDVSQNTSLRPSANISDSFESGVSAKANSDVTRNVLHVTSMQEGILELARGAPKIEVDRATGVHPKESHQPNVAARVAPVTQVTPVVAEPKADKRKAPAPILSRDRKEAVAVTATVDARAPLPSSAGTALPQSYVGARPRSNIAVPVGELTAQAEISLSEVETSVETPELTLTGKPGTGRFDLGRVDDDLDVKMTVGNELRRSNVTEADVPQTEFSATRDRSAGVVAVSADFGIRPNEDEVTASSLEPVSEPVVVAKRWIPTGDMKTETQLIAANSQTISPETQHLTIDGATDTDHLRGVKVEAVLPNGTELPSAQVTSPETNFKVHAVAGPPTVATAKVPATAAPPAASTKDEKKSGGILIKNPFKNKASKKTEKLPSGRSTEADSHASLHVAHTGSVEVADDKTHGGDVHGAVSQHPHRNPDEDFVASKRLSIDAELPAVSLEGNTVNGSAITPEVGFKTDVSNTDGTMPFTDATPVSKLEAAMSIDSTTSSSLAVESESGVKRVPVGTNASVAIDPRGIPATGTSISASIQQPASKPAAAVDAKGHKKGSGSLFKGLFKSRSTKKSDHGQTINEDQRQFVVDSAAVTPSASESIGRSGDANTGDVTHLPAVRPDLPSGEKFRRREIGVDASSDDLRVVSKTIVGDFDKPRDVHISTKQPAIDGQERSLDRDAQGSPEGDGSKLLITTAKSALASETEVSANELQVEKRDYSVRKTDDDGDADVERVHHASEPSSDSGEFDFSLGSGGMDLNAETMLETAGLRPLATKETAESDIGSPPTANGVIVHASVSSSPPLTSRHNDDIDDDESSPAGELSALPSFGRLGRASATADLSRLEMTPIDVADDSSDEDEENDVRTKYGSDLPPAMPPPPPPPSDEPPASELTIKLANGRSDSGRHGVDDSDGDDEISPRRETLVLRSEEGKTVAKVGSGGDMNNNEASDRLRHS
jgi:hypothetical protein